MEIQVTFADGTTETRPSWSPVLWRGRNDGTDRCTPPDLSWILFSFAWYEAGRLAWGHACRGDTRKEHCAISVDLSTCRGIGNRHVWRITGQDTITKALIGEWVTARVETYEEQIERLTRERGADKARADAAEKRLADLRVWAVEQAKEWYGVFTWDQVVTRIDGKAEGQ